MPAPLCPWPLYPPDQTLVLWRLPFQASGSARHICSLVYMPTILQVGVYEMNPWVRKSLEEEMATHSSILAWKIPWTEEPGELQFMGLQSQTRLK